MARKMKNRLGEEEEFEGIKGRLASGGLVPREIFLGEVNKGSGDIQVVGDELLIEIGEA